MSDSENVANGKGSSIDKKKKPFSYRLKIFSMQYLAHHPVCHKFDNHIFRLGSLFLCVGCLSVILGFITHTAVFFSLLPFFRSFPYVSGSIAALGVGLALIQVFLKPNNRWLKIVFRFSLGIGLGAYTAIIVLAANLSYTIGFYAILIQFLLFILLIPGIYLYNVIRGASPYLECKDCEDKFIEPTCDYNVVSNYES